jgi:hypothetical protein
MIIYHENYGDRLAKFQERYIVACATGLEFKGKFIIV